MACAQTNGPYLVLEECGIILEEESWLCWYHWAAGGYGTATGPAVVSAQLWDNHGGADQDQCAIDGLTRTWCVTPPLEAPGWFLVAQGACTDLIATVQVETNGALGHGAATETARETQCHPW